MTDEPNSTSSGDDHVEDAYERLARDAGAALRRPAPSDGVARLRAARRRQQTLRTAIAGGTTAVIVVVGLVVISRRSDQTVTPSDTVAAAATPATTTSSTTTATVVPTTTIPAGPSLEYTFTGVNGLAPIGDPIVTDAAGFVSMISVWSTIGGITDGYLALYETGEVGATEPEGDVTTVSVEVPDGHAYLVTDNGPDGLPTTLPSATRLMWWRGDGRRWIVSNFGLTAERMTELTLAIQPGSGLPFVLADPAVMFVGFNPSEVYESTRQEWALEGTNLTLAVTTGGLAQQLADVTAVSVVERPIAGAIGYAITLPNGQINLTWPATTPGCWGSVMIPAALAERVDEIVTAITRI